MNEIRKPIEELNEVLIEEKDFLRLEHKYHTELLWPPSSLKEWYLRLDIARCLKVYDFFCKKIKEELQILVIDDHLERFKEILEKVASKFPIIFYYPVPINQGWERWTEDIIKSKSNSSEWRMEGICSKGTSSVEMGLEGIDLILLDLYFENKSYTGGDILRRLKWDHPGIPVFILTKSHDIEEIKKAYNLDAEHYITKDRLVGFPWFYCEFCKHQLGDIIFEFCPKDRRKLIGCILQWRRNKTLLWHGEKTYHMVEHTFEHSKMMWKLLNELNHFKLFKGISKKILYALTLSIWLHDVGYKGYSRMTSPYLVRKKHPLISGELIKEFPHIYLMQDGEMKKNIALISAYHLLGAPIDRSVVENIGKENIDKDFVYPSSFDFLNDYAKEKIGRNSEEIIYLNLFGEELCFPAAILRIIDDIDKGVHRAGTGSEEDAKLAVTIQDALYYVLETENEIRNLTDKLGNIKYSKPIGEILRHLSEFQKGLKEWIETSYKPLFRNEDKNENLNKMMRNPELFADKAENKYLTLYKTFTSYKERADKIFKGLERNLPESVIEKIKLLIKQIFYLLDSPLHFYTHRSVMNPRIEKAKNGYDIVYHFNRDFLKLEGVTNFADFNRLFQEAWKIFSDIFEEYIPIEKILLDNSLQFNGVKFLSVNNGRKKDWFYFPFEKRFIENEVKIKFDTKIEMENFIQLLKYKIGISPRNTQREITDTFFDVKVPNTPEWILRRRGWTLRRRESESQTVWGIKVVPLYWKGGFNHRIEIELHINQKEPNNFEIFRRILEGESNHLRICLPELDEIRPNVLESIVKYVQIREEYEYKGIIEGRGEFYFKISADRVIKHSNIYIVKIESIENTNEAIQRRVLEKFIEKISKYFPEIYEHITTGTKLDLVIE